MRKEQVPGHLTAEHRPRLTHLFFDQRVPDAPHHGLTARALNLVENCAAALHFTDERCAGLLRQDRARKQDHQLVAPQDASATIHRRQAICISVERNANLRTAATHRILKLAQVFRHRRVRQMQRKATVHLTRDALRRKAKLRKQRQRNRTTRSISRVEHHRKAPRSKLKPRLHKRQIVRADILQTVRSQSVTERAGCHNVAQTIQLTAIEAPSLTDDLEAVVTRGIVAASDLHTAIDGKRHRGVIQHRRGNHPQVNDRHPARQQSRKKRGMNPRRVQTTVSPDHQRHPATVLNQRSNALSDGLHHIVGQVAVGDPSDVVLAEHQRVHRNRVRPSF